jgi:hypothetical protein
LTKERLAELGDLLSNAVSVGPMLVLECLDAIEQLQSEKDRLVQEVYRLNSMMNGPKAETSPPCDGEVNPNPSMKSPFPAGGTP